MSSTRVEAQCIASLQHVGTRRFCLPRIRGRCPAETEGMKKSYQHMAGKFAILVLLSILLIPTITAQDVDPIPITLNESITVELNPDAVVTLAYTTDESQYVSIFTQTNPNDENAPDTVLEVLTEDFIHIEYQDDQVYETDDEEPPIFRDAQILGLFLPEAGTYYIRVDSFNGVSEGDVEVTISEADMNSYECSALIVECRLRFVMNFACGVQLSKGDVGCFRSNREFIRIHPNVVYSQEVDAVEGSRLIITARDMFGTLDPVLLLLDEEGNILARNDDHGTTDLTLDAFDAQISNYKVESNGVLTVQAYDFLGREGLLELTITQETPESSP